MLKLPVTLCRTRVAYSLAATAIAAVVMRARSTSDSASADIQIRSFELAVLKQKLKNTRLFVLTGPKEVGKSFLVRKMAETDGTVIYIDLKAKSTVSEIKALFDSQVEENLSKNKVITEESTKKSAKISPRDLGASFESLQKFAPVNPPDSSFYYALRQLIESKVAKFYVYTPTVLVIDEAQTMKVLSQSERDAFFEFVSSVTRDGKMAVLFVTSDFESLRELIGNRMLAEAEVMTLSYISEPSARFLWDSYINSSTHSSLAKLSKLQKDELFKSVHGICAGNIADMLRMKFALECSPNFERAKADLVANAATTRLSAFQLYDQSSESLSDEDRNKLRLLKLFLTSIDGYVSLSSIPPEYLPLVKIWIKENFLSTFIGNLIPIDDQGTVIGPQARDKMFFFPAVAIRSVFMRLYIQESSANRLQIELKVENEMYAQKKQRLKDENEVNVQRLKDLF